jgi:hypothetical protein
MHAYRSMADIFISQLKQYQIIQLFVVVSLLSKPNIQAM